MVYRSPEFEKIITEHFDLSDKGTFSYLRSIEEADQNKVLVALTSKLYDHLVEKVDDIEISAKNLGMFRKKFYDIYLEHSKLTEEKLKEICSKEDYSTPQELLDWGIVDEII